MIFTEPTRYTASLRELQNDAQNVIFTEPTPYTARRVQEPPTVQQPKALDLQRVQELLQRTSIHKTTVPSVSALLLGDVLENRVNRKPSFDTPCTASFP